MNQKSITTLLAAMLSLLAFAALVTGLIKDEKSFYLVATLCLGLASAFSFFTYIRIRMGK